MTRFEIFAIIAPLMLLATTIVLYVIHGVLNARQRAADARAKADPAE